MATTASTAGRTQLDRSQPSAPAKVGRTSGRMTFLFGFVAIWSVIYACGVPTATGIELGVLAAVSALLVAGMIEWRASNVPPRRVVSRLGLGRPAMKGMVVGVLVATLVAATLPIYAFIAGIDLTLRPRWPLLLVTLFAYHGIAEEIAWRGYAFAHLRTGSTFRSAVLRTMPLLALTHVPVLVEGGIAVGLAAIAVAAVTCVPLAHLYELGGRTIWPAALVHAAIDGFKLLEDPGADPRVTGAISIAALLIPLLGLAWHRPAIPVHDHAVHDASTATTSTTGDDVTTAEPSHLQDVTGLQLLESTFHRFVGDRRDRSVEAELLRSVDDRPSQHERCGESGVAGR
jgi:hypothetical protein